MKNKVKVSAISIGTGGDHNTKIKQAIKYLQISGQYNVDIACLPEKQVIRYEWL